MTRKIAVISVAAATTALVAGGLTLTSSAATSSKTHTVHYTAKTVSTEKLDGLDAVTNVNLTSRHLASAGKLKGAAEFTCHQNSPSAKSERCKGALALKGGMIYVSAKLPFSTYELSGHITGGSGAYAGAKGLLYAVGGDGIHRSIITIRYKL